MKNKKMLGRALTEKEFRDVMDSKPIRAKGTNDNANVHVGKGSEDSYLISLTGSLVQLFTKRAENSDLRITGSAVILADNSSGMAYNLSDEEDRKEIGLTSATAIGYAKGSNEYLIRGLIPVERTQIFAKEDEFKNIFAEISAKYTDTRTAEKELYSIDFEMSVWHDESKKVQLQKAISRVEFYLWQKDFYRAMQWLYYVENCMPSGKTWWKALR